MEHFSQRSLEELHLRLMNEVKSDNDAISEELEVAIDNLGVYTQEILTNEEEPTGRMETALSAACRLAKPQTVCQLLHLQAIPTLKVYRSLMTNVQRDSRPMIASRLLMFTRPSVRLHVFWLACIHNEVEIVELCLQNPYIDSNAKMDLDFDPALRETWKLPERPLPIQYAASQNYERIVQYLELYFDEDRHAAEDTYVDYLLIAAYRRHLSLAEQILARRRATTERYARIYEIVGASEVAQNNSARGKTLWKKAISLLESSGIHRSRLPTEILCLEPTFQDYRTAQDIDEMRAKELRVQALSIIRKYFGDSYIFADALVKRDYSKRISVYGLKHISSQDRMTAVNLKKLENSLDQLKFFLFPERDLVIECLHWCIDFVGQLRSLLEIQPCCIEDLNRLSALVDFTCKILLTVEIIETSFEGQDEVLKAELNHLLRRVVAVFQPLNEKCCLLDRLHDIRKNRPGIENIFRILNDATADLVVTDGEGNVLRDYGERFRCGKVSSYESMKQANNNTFSVMSEH